MGSGGLSDLVNATGAQMPRALPVELFMYEGLGLMLALTPTPNPYQKPRAMLY